MQAMGRRGRRIDRGKSVERARGSAAVIVGLITAVLTSVLVAVPAADARSSSSPFSAEIRRTSYGMPNIYAKSYADAGYGLGYAFASDKLCEVAPHWVEVRGQQSLYFGETPEHLASDAFWQGVQQAGVLRRLLNRGGVNAPLPQVRELTRGYAAGYNQYLAETGVDRLPDPRCRGQRWVRPITEKDVWLNTLNTLFFNVQLGAGQYAKQMFGAAPPGSEQGQAVARVRASAPEPDGDRVGDLGSNMVALGRRATDNGRGLLWANPHWLWQGPYTFHEAHITIPGKLNVIGFSVLGSPVFSIGANEQAAWSHTVSTPANYVLFELKLAPGDPTSYIYEGREYKMKARKVRIPVQTQDGRIEWREHVYWDTRFGTIVESDSLPWTADRAYALTDPSMHFRHLNQQFRYARARSVYDIERAGAQTLGIPYFNTIAADSRGNAFFGALQSVPHVTDAQVERCITTATAKTLLERGVFALDGSRADCQLGSDADSVVPGIFGASSLPTLHRDDYVTNSNASHWTTNLRELLTGFPQIMGDEETPRGLRTRMGLYKLEGRLSGEDGRPGRRFSLDSFIDITMNNEVYSGILWRDAAVEMCRSMPASANVTEACGVLARWDLTEDLDSAGAVLWRRFAERVDIVPDRFTVPFDPADPMNTPRGLNTSNPAVQQALTDAVADLRGSGIPLDATLRGYQWVDKNGERIPIHGGPGEIGQYNAIWTDGWTPGVGYPNVSGGSSWIMYVQYTDHGPVGRSVLTYSNSTNPSSPHFTDQTWLFAQKGFKPMLFTEAEVLSDPNLTVKRLCALRSGRPCRQGGDDDSGSGDGAAEPTQQFSLGAFRSGADRGAGGR